MYALKKGEDKERGERKMMERKKTMCSVYF